MSERSESVISPKRRRVRDSEENREELGENLKETRWEELFISRKAPPAGYNIHKKKEHIQPSRQELPTTHYWVVVVTLYSHSIDGSLYFLL